MTDKREEALRLPLMPDIGLGPQARSFIQDWCDECVRLARQSAPQQEPRTLLVRESGSGHVIATIPHPEDASPPAQPDAQAEIERLKKTADHWLIKAHEYEQGWIKCYAEWYDDCKKLHEEIERLKGDIALLRETLPIVAKERDELRVQLAAKPDVVRDA